MGRPELSVIVPTFDRADPTARAVRSVLAQDDVDLEVVVVDDASPAPFAFDGDPRVVVVRLERNSGAAAARNAGVAASQADWIAFLDSDDVWTPGSLRARLDAARAAGEPDRTIWGAGFIDVWPDGRHIARMPVASADPVALASGCWSCPGSTALFSRTAWRQSGGQNAALRRLEDYDWLLRWGALGGRLEIAPIVAAEITRGGRAAPAAIASAAGYLREKHANSREIVRRRIESYLALEAGASLLHHGKFAAGTLALARSWALKPRLQAALEPFWRRAPLGG
jgi:glycosyltransferase involved in cell wall biosynthesis